MRGELFNTKDVDWFGPEPVGYVHDVLLRVLCIVRNDFASNLGGESLGCQTLVVQ